MACLDTATILDLNGRAGKRLLTRATECVRAFLVRGEVLCTTRLNVAELWVGAHRSDEPETEQKRVQAMLDPLVILEVDEEAAERFGQISAALLSRGRPIGDFDVLIAAIALNAGEPIITRNVKHFGQIPGLQVIAY